MNETEILLSKDVEKYLDDLVVPDLVALWAKLESLQTQLLAAIERQGCSTKSFFKTFEIDEELMDKACNAHQSCCTCPYRTYCRSLGKTTK